MSDRPTPLTDDECAKRSYRFCDAPDANVWINSDFARSLERQLAEAKEALETIVKVASRHDWIGPAGEMDAALAACRRLIEAKEVEP